MQGISTCHAFLGGGAAKSEPRTHCLGVGDDLSLFPLSVRPDDHSKVFSMTGSSRYVFVNGPDIASSNSKYDGRAIRSAMMRRTLREKQRSSKPCPLSLKWFRICRCRPAEALPLCSMHVA